MASVVATITSSASNVDLTALGAADYVIYNGNTALTTFNRKSGGGSLISVVEYDPSSAYTVDTENKSRIFSASDATPTSSVSTGDCARSVSFGTQAAGGFITTFPASTGERTCKVYVMGFNNDAVNGNSVEVVCTLGDASASDTKTASITPFNDNFFVIDVTYTANSTTTLDVRFNLQSSAPTTTIRATHWGAAWVSSPTATGSTGTVATTNANDTSAASGTTTVTGTFSTTNANDAPTASGTTIVTGTGSTTNANDSVVASGSVGAAVSGTSTTTNANDTSTASGTTTIAGTSATTNANDIPTASGVVSDPITGMSSTTNANDIVSANGTVVGGGKSGVNREQLAKLTERLGKKPAKETKVQPAVTVQKEKLVVTENSDGSFTVEEIVEEPVVQEIQVPSVQEIAPPTQVVAQPGLDLDAVLLQNLITQTENQALLEQQNLDLMQKAADRKANILKQMQEEDEMIIQYAIEVLL